MKAIIKIEAIGDNTYQYFRLYKKILNEGAPGLGNSILEGMGAPYWCAKITGFDPKYKYAREFLKPKKDYSESNSVGSRGIFLFYILENNCLYEVSKPITWKKLRRYFCVVDNNGEIIEIKKEDVDQWIKEHLESAS